jgi:hypothetical protein
LVNPAIVTKPEDLSPERQSVLTEPGLGFRFEGDFNADGRRDLVLLGQHGQDQRRSFVLIATAQGGGWARSGLLTFEAEFVVAKKVENGRVWIFFCANCDYGGSLEWTGSQYVLQPFSFSVVAALGHLGSDTKAMTATVIGLMVERGRLRWDTTIEEQRLERSCRVDGTAAGPRDPRGYESGRRGRNDSHQRGVHPAPRTPPGRALRKETSPRFGPAPPRV